MRVRPDLRGAERSDPSAYSAITSPSRAILRERPGASPGPSTIGPTTKPISVSMAVTSMYVNTVSGTLCPRSLVTSHTRVHRQFSVTSRGDSSKGEGSSASGSRPINRSRFVSSNVLQQPRRRFIRRVLFHRVAAYGRVQHEAAQAADGVRRVSHPVMEGKEAFGVHSSGGPKSASSARTIRRSCGTVVLGIIPDAFGHHACIAMDQQVPEVDDPAQPGNPFGEFRMEPSAGGSAPRR